jgi:Sugar kinases, ribokinase family
MKFIVVGPTIVNDIVFADGTEKKQQLGGSVYCLAGIKLWTDDCLYVSNVGSDFSRFYGEWMDRNRCSRDGLNTILPHTHYTRLVYGEEDLHDEYSIYGPEIEAESWRLDVVTAEQLGGHCSPDTSGIYIEANERDPLWDNLDGIRRGCGAKIMWELPTSACMDQGRRADVMKALGRVDMYSVNLPEAMRLFDCANEEVAIAAVARHGGVCFLRAGKKGSYLVAEGKAHFASSLTVGSVVDATGCGNASTAAAMYGYCSGFSPAKAARAANISAAFNLLQHGPYPECSQATRDRAAALLSDGVTL